MGTPPPTHLKNQNFEEPRLHDPGTFGGFGKREQTDIQDSCFISIDINECYNYFKYHKCVY